MNIKGISNWIGASIFCLMLFAPAFSATAEGKIYKWRDENGKLHFSDKPPKNQQKIKTDEIKIKDQRSPEQIARAKSEAARRLTIQRRKMDSLEDQKLQEQQEKAQKDKQEKDRRYACAVARQDLKTLKSRGVVTSINKDGQQVFFTDEERNKLIMDYENFISKNCSE